MATDLSLEAIGPHTARRYGVSGPWDFPSGVKVLVDKPDVKVTRYIGPELGSAFDCLGIIGYQVVLVQEIALSAFAAKTETVPPCTPPQYAQSKLERKKSFYGINGAFHTRDSNPGVPINPIGPRLEEGRVTGLVGKTSTLPELRKTPFGIKFPCDATSHIPLDYMDMYETLIFRPEGTVSHCLALDASEEILSGAQSALSGAPVLVRDGKVAFGEDLLSEDRFKLRTLLARSDLTKPVACPDGALFHADQLNPRSAIGIKNVDGKTSVVMMTCLGRSDGAHGVTLPQLAQLMKYQGVEYALNVDGGVPATQLAFSATEGVATAVFQTSPEYAMPPYMLGFERYELL